MQQNVLSSNQMDFFSEKGDSIQSFKYKSNATVEKPVDKPKEVMTLQVPGSKS